MLKQRLPELCTSFCLMGLKAAIYRPSLQSYSFVLTVKRKSSIDLKSKQMQLAFRKKREKITSKQALYLYVCVAFCGFIRDIQN